MDTDGSDSIDLREFLKAIDDFKLEFNEQKATNIFNSLDRDHGGTISIDEFIDGVIGPLSTLRYRLIEEAFNHLDKDGSKSLDMSEVKDMFEGKRHPECLSGEKTAEQCKVEFLNLFKAHNNASTGFNNETAISLQDFVQYHQILSTFYEKDAEFKNFLVGVWNMDLKQVDNEFAGKKPAIQGKNSREQWKMENY
jgi:Ca2+-binding EF-hand superfamily protein